MPSIRRWFATLCGTSCPHTTAQVRGAAEIWCRGRSEVVLARFLASLCTPDTGLPVEVATGVPLEDCLGASSVGAAAAGSRPRRRCNPSGRPLVSSGEPFPGSWYGGLRRRHGDAAGAEALRRRPPPWGWAEVCALDSSVGRPSACSSREPAPGETAMIGPEFSQVLSVAACGDEEALAALARPAAPRAAVLRRCLAGCRRGSRLRDVARRGPGHRALPYRAGVSGFGVHHRPPRSARQVAPRCPPADGGPCRRRSDGAGGAGRPGRRRRGGVLHQGRAGGGRHLPADQAEAIVLRVVAGLDVDRVAAIMDKRPGTVRVLTHRGAPPAGRAPR